MTRTIFDKLADPFPPDMVTWKPGTATRSGDRCLAMAYGDLRAYMYRLDDVVGPENWEVEYQPWGDHIIAYVTIYPKGRDGYGVRKGSTGEPDKNSEKNEIAGTVAEAQAFKRACAMHGLGRYLYDLPSKWVAYDSESRKIKPEGLAELRKMVQDHYDSVMNEREFGDYTAATVGFIKHMREIVTKKSKEATPQKYGVLTGRLESIVGTPERRYRVLGVLLNTEYKEGDRVSTEVADTLLKYLDPASNVLEKTKAAIEEIAG